MNEAFYSVMLRTLLSDFLGEQAVVLSGSVVVVFVFLGRGGTVSAGNLLGMNSLVLHNEVERFRRHGPIEVRNSSFDGNSNIAYRAQFKSLLNIRKLGTDNISVHGELEVLETRTGLSTLPSGTTKLRRLLKSFSTAEVLKYTVKGLSHLDQFPTLLSNCSLLIIRHPRSIRLLNIGFNEVVNFLSEVLLNGLPKCGDQTNSICTMIGIDESGNLRNQLLAVRLNSLSSLVEKFRLRRILNIQLRIQVLNLRSDVRKLDLERTSKLVHSTHYVSHCCLPSMFLGRGIVVS